MREHRNVYRMPHDAGWLVAIGRRGKYWRRYFSDRAAGGQAAGLRAALRWRDELINTLPPPIRFRRGPGRSRSGVVGVHLSRERTRAGRPMSRYVATWHDGRRPFKRTFSVAKFGERRARAMAIKTRREAVKELLAQVGMMVGGMGRRRRRASIR